MNGACTGGTTLEATSFMYDGDGKLVKKVHSGGSRTFYVGGIYEVDKDASRTREESVRKVTVIFEDDRHFYSSTFTSPDS